MNIILWDEQNELDPDVPRDEVSGVLSVSESEWQILSGGSDAAEIHLRNTNHDQDRIIEELMDRDQGKVTKKNARSTLKKLFLYV